MTQENAALALFEMFSYIFIALLAIFNFSYLYQYILTKRRNDFAIIKIYGCANFLAVKVFLSELLLLSAGTFICSSLLFHFGLRRIYAYKRCVDLRAYRI